jgi:acyl carrier protein
MFHPVVDAGKDGKAGVYPVGGLVSPAKVEYIGAQSLGSAEVAWRARRGPPVLRRPSHVDTGVSSLAPPAESDPGDDGKGLRLDAAQTKARAVISEFLQRLEKEPEVLDEKTALWGDGLGLDSLEAAELSALLEDELGSDPFSAGHDMPETVGDILDFYDSHPGA